MVEVIILAAGDIRNKLPFLEPKSTCPALLPLNTKPLLNYIINFYQGKADNINVFVSEGHKQEVEKEVNPNKFKYNLYSVPRTNGVVETLKIALGYLSGTKDVIVNLVTTIPTKFPELNEVQVSNELTPYPVGSSIAFNGNQIYFISKNEEYVKSGFPFTGIFRCKKNNLEISIDRTEKYDDLLNVIKAMYNVNPIKFEKVDWIDCGHEINYFSAKNKLISSRAFNKMEILSKEGIIKKKSDNKKKLFREYKYITMLPMDIKVFFPRIIDYYENEGRGIYEIEYYGYPNVSEYLLYWSLSDGHWHRMFSRFFYIFSKLREHKFSIGYETFRGFYWGKTAQRVEEFTEQLQGLESDTNWLLNKMVINNTECKPYYQLKEKIEQKIESLYNEDDFCIMHGDFTFNNILYDLPTGIVRLIDQRGSFGEKAVGIYGDQKYDLAKLAHSVIGCYDYIVNDLYKIEHKNDQVTYSFLLRENYKLIKQLLINILKDLGYNLNDIYFIMGLLFLSMTPLHYDSPDRQKLMYLHGIRIINETLNNNYENLH